MTWPSLADVLLLLSFGWLFIVGVPIHHQWTLMQAADGYRTAELLVTDPHCIRSDSSQRSSTSRCFLAGTIDGVPAELSTDSSLPPEHPAGSRVRVLFNPSMPEIGWNHQSLRVVPWEADLAAASRLRIAQLVGLVALSWLLTASVHVGLRHGVRQRSLSTQGRFTADIGGGAPGLGMLVGGLGLTLVFGQLTRGGVAVAGLVMGLALTAAGAWLLRRTQLTVPAHGNRLVLDTHVLGVGVGQVVHDVAPRSVVGLRGERAPWVLAIGPPDEQVTVASTYELAEARGWGRSLAGTLGCVWRDEVAEAPAPPPGV